MALRRRDFLQQTALALGGLGLSELGLALLGDRYHQVLAQPTGRKLALLVGVNQYDPAPEKIPALAGCLTDVELQRELLQYRFGFHNSDILVLTEQQATRSNIETAFTAHLIEQARPGDVVVFHFSGYGRQIELNLTPNSPTLSHYNQQNALMSVDSSPSSSRQHQSINDILEDTLFLLLRSLATDQITTVLDASYYYPGSALVGGLRVRARPAVKGELAAAELALQEQLLQQTKISREQVQVQQRSSQLPGVVLAATQAGQIATETPWPGFNAGLFTYALTQHLWSTTPPSTIWMCLSQSAAAVEYRAGKNQQPELKGQQGRQQVPAYNLTLGTAADGVITEINDNGRTGQIWLAGVPLDVLETYGAAVFQTVPLITGGAAISPPEIEANSLIVHLKSRAGLVAKGQLAGIEQLQVGQLVQEVIRVLPREGRLIMALDSDLDRVERVDATSAFSSLGRIGTVIAAEQPADVLFAKVTLQNFQVKQSEDANPWHVLVDNANQPVNSYGLFTLGRELIPTTLGEPGEAIKAAVLRLTAKMQILLAAKLLGQTVNASSSQLGVSAALEMIAPEAQVLMRQITARARWPIPDAAKSSLAKAEKSPGLLSLTAGSKIQYRIYNYSDRPRYLMLLGFDSSLNAFTFYTPVFPATLGSDQVLIKNEFVAPGTTLTLPRQSDTFEWAVRGPAGLVTHYLIFSSQPLNNTLAMLEAIVRQRQPSDGPQTLPLSNALEIVQKILQDLHQASQPEVEALGVNHEAVALDVRNWATLRFCYRVN